MFALLFSKQKMNINVCFQKMHQLFNKIKYSEKKVERAKILLHGFLDCYMYSAKHQAI